MDASFSSNSELELFEVPYRSENTNPNLKLVGKVSSKSRFYRLAWSDALKDRTHGLIAGGLENGLLEVWDPKSILDGNVEKSLVFSNSNHHGSVSGVEFNPIQGSLLATGAENGEVLVWDVNSDFKSYSPGARSQRLEKITDLAWNNQVQHILATSSNSGASVVWDLRNRREIIALVYNAGMGMNSMGMGQMGGMMMGGNRLGISSISWNPDNATQLATASEDDNNPVVMMWDLRNANAPSAVLQGHSRGVLSLSWCKKDSSLLLSSGKDNRTICWNPQTQEIVGELPVGNNWVFDVQWCQNNPNYLSTASFDGRVNVYPIESSTKQEEAQTTVVDDPFAPNALSSQGSSLYLKKAPKWLARPCGATFGFGGQLVHFAKVSQETADPNSIERPKVLVENVVSEPQLAEQAKQLEAQLENNQATNVCDARIGQLGDSDPSRSWHVLRLLFEPEAREKLVEFLGYDKAKIAQELQNIAEKTAADKNQNASDADAPQPEASEGSKTAYEEHGESPFDGTTEGNDNDFFSQKTTTADFSQDQSALHGDSYANDKLVSSLTPLFKNSFSISKVNDGDNVEESITRAIVVGEIETAVEICIQNKRFADALVMSTIGSPELKQRVQKAYFESRGADYSYARLLHGIVTDDLTDVVKNADLFEWEQILVLLCTYTQGQQFTDLCKVLGSRLEMEANNQSQNGKPSNDLLKNAVLCYLASGHLEKVVHIWIAQEREEAMASGSGPHASATKRTQALHNLIEKISVFRTAVDYIDPFITNDNTEIGQGPPAQGYPLAALYDHYTDYAEFLASQGMLDIAVNYLKRTPSGYKRISRTNENELAILKHRLANRGVYHSTVSLDLPWNEHFVGPDYSREQQQQQQQQEQQQQQQQQQQQNVQPQQQFPTPQYGQFDYQTSQVPYSQQPTVPGFVYNSQDYYGAQQQAFGYQGGYSSAPSYSQSTYPVSSSGMVYGNNAAQPSTLVPPPPPSINRGVPSSQPTPPPPRQEGAWNDPPIMQKKPKPSQKSKGPINPITSPFAQAAGTPPPPMTHNQAFPNSSHGSMPPPPPKGTLPPKPAIPPPRPFTSGPPQQQQPAQPPQLHQQQQPLSQNPLAVNPPYSQPPQVYNSYQPHGMAGPFPQTVDAFSQGYQSGGQPSTAITRGKVVSPTPSTRSQTPLPHRNQTPQPTTKYPPGDRSHIPPAWMDIYKQLNASAEILYRGANPAQGRVVEDTKKRINALFDKMNCDIVPDSDKVLPKFKELAVAFSQRNYPAVLEIVTDTMKISRDLTKELMGVKRVATLLRDIPH
ncbi:protein transport protein S31 [Mycoemilia scoparia]|uniref:Protein transport protein SEC31 n=1 Tax=Mycoemilia scoparia TaxID=417184 RepID=A0A9W8DTE8_9FUNG|nr:protein transport protein S31 [Mycoemilia scoparia]